MFIQKVFSFVDIHTEISPWSSVHTTFDHWIYKNNSRFKKCLNIASTADEQIYYYLNYHSIGYLTMY